MTIDGLMWLVTWKHGKQACASWASTQASAIAGARQLEEEYEAEDLRQMQQPVDANPKVRYNPQP